MKKTPQPTKSTVITADQIPDAPHVERGVMKSPYNHRTRSLVRTFIDAFEDEATKRRLRSQMRDLTTFTQIRDYMLLLVPAEKIDSLIVGWFDNGMKAE
jgi:hypothetical protein